MPRRSYHRMPPEPRSNKELVVAVLYGLVFGVLATLFVLADKL